MLHVCCLSHISLAILKGELSLPHHIINVTNKRYTGRQVHERVSFNIIPRISDDMQIYQPIDEQYHPEIETHRC